VAGRQLVFETLGAFNGLKAGETATVEVQYGVGDGIAGAVGRATVTVVGANDAPVAAPDAAAIGEDGPWVAIDALANDSDPDGDALQPLWASQPAAGRASVAGRQLVFETLGAFNGLKAGETATVEIQYGVGDGIAGAVGRATVTVVGANDAPVAAPDAVVIGEDDPWVAIDALVNDSDPDGDALQLLWASQPAAGRASVAGRQVVFETLGAFNGLKAGETATVEVQYGVGDGIAGAVGRATLTVVGANDAPVARPDAGVGFSTAADTPFATASALANDADADGDALSVTGLDVSGTRGRVTLGGDGVFSYDPTGRFDDLAAGETAIDRFSYTVSDGAGGAATTLVEIAVTGVARPMQRVVVHAAGQNHQGDPSFDLLVNGVVAVEGVAVASTSAWRAPQDRDFGAFAFEIDPAVAIESVGVAYRGDRYGGTPDADRNLFVSAVEFGGRTYTAREHGVFAPAGGADARKEAVVNAAGEMFWGGVLTFEERRSVIVHAAGQSHLGAPKFDVLINGQTVARRLEPPSSPGALTVERREAAADAFAFKLDADTRIETVAIAYRNDAYGGSADSDRNLFIPFIEIDGATIRPDGVATFQPKGFFTEALRRVAEADGALYVNGTLSFDVAGLAEF
jgi:VCBS repeat-containing protein